MKSICKFYQMIKGFFCLLLLFNVCLSSCDDDNLLGETTLDRGIEFYFDMPKTRAIVDEETGTGFFEDNDEVGLYADENGIHRYHRLTLQGGHWLPFLKPSDLGKSKVTLTAFYPAPENPVEPELHVITCAVQTDQSSEKGYLSSDLLGAQHEMTMDNPDKEISMTFRHLMHRLNISLTGLDTNAPDFAIEVYGRTQGLFDISAKGSLQPDEDSPEEWIIPHKMGNGSYVVLFAPQPVDIGEDRIRIVCNGKTYNYKFSDGIVGDSQNLESGKETNVQLRFTEEAGEPSDEEFAGKKLWLWGVEREGHPLPVFDENTAEYAFVGTPEKFPVGKWFHVFPDDLSTCYLSWQEDYGWYDCDKFNPEAGEDHEGPKDGHMCWAASASNSLHWWMYHNRDYIEEYDKMYPEEDELMSSFIRPSYEFNGVLGEDVFTFFRETCRDEAGYASFGINWFITGYGYNIPYKDKNVADNFKGFFRHAFSKDDVIATTEKPLTKEKFNDVIKDAFKNNRSLTFSVYSMGGHAMTIWGVEFDEKGIVSALYYVDNNDYYNFEVSGSSTPYQHHRCIRKIVRYQDDIYMPILLGTGTVAITDLGQVDLRRDIWEKWKQSLNK